MMASMRRPPSPAIPCGTFAHFFTNSRTARGVGGRASQWSCASGEERVAEMRRVCSSVRSSCGSGDGIGAR